MDTFGEKIKKLREDLSLPLRTVAAYLDIDQAILSKIERGQRNANRQQVIKLALYFQADKNELLIAWLSDKLVAEMENEELAMEAFQVAEEKVIYENFKKVDRNLITNKIKDEISKFPNINKAWIFGSFARKDDGPKSDIDIAIQADGKFSYYDLAEVQYKLEKTVNRKIDVGFLDSFQPYIFENVQKDLNLIYER
ncbi:MAG: nucleotidyltransferase domain-containing protein [Bacteroidota bacterium]